ncbi:MAG TPA: hypothetical protein VEX68_14930 [Bryobacteraceae bacterium]|nr:hypothetical protein [Bryobacteraceae bacterium]
MTRLDRLQPFALQMPMVPAAAVSPRAQAAMETHMAQGKAKLAGYVRRYIEWLRGPEGLAATPEEGQRRFTILRLRFNAVLTQIDIFSDVVVQRSQHGMGVWVAGLDVLAADALAPIAPYVDLPPAVCYLDRGVGAAIRRARTRLPGGDENPLAIIRVPRERMVGSGIAASLLHEAGHEAAAQLDLVNELRQALLERQHAEPDKVVAWRYWERCISEIVADFWAVALLGLTATLGLLAVVSLPRAFVFRLSLEDPHPFPWIRVKLSCAMGSVLYPSSQWERVEALWESMYPLEGLPDESRRVIDLLQEQMQRFVSLLTSFRPTKLKGLRVVDVLPMEERTPAKLAAIHEGWRKQSGRVASTRPALAFAVLGQARAEGKISPEHESAQLADLLTTWALSSSLETSTSCAKQVLSSARRTQALQNQQSTSLGERYAIH